MNYSLEPVEGKPNLYTPKVDGEKRLPETPCPACGAVALRVEQRLEAKPIGTWSLAGSQMKVFAGYWPWLVCGACGVEARGEIDDG